ncbi:Poly [ADP-ribose] polymerase 12 [Channa argus]|uniref:Poly [ADP-ribose] polymerase 12 n=1 Tax=Channa argus TaxID=215402 RepID=A0A6G1QQG4_CHAAH|nr:Poly [ADP-ribose] polymerase 12 [Channa argus]
MEAEIFRFICANQGAVNTDDLLFNLDSTNVSEIISNRDKFVLCCPNGQPKVVARAKLRLCRVKDCPGTCRGLHLCKNFLFTGSCQFTRQRRGCSFSHDLNSNHNEMLFKEHELEGLSRAELCTLLLQSDNTLLPPICFDYNNGTGIFGRCQEGDGCKRLHICEKYLKGDCSCFRAHDFNAPQPLKTLQDKCVPADLIRSFRCVYANKEALRIFDQSNRGNRQRQQPGFFTSDASATATDTDATSDSGWNSKPMQWIRGRGRPRGGHRGNRGYRGNRGNRGTTSNLQPKQRAFSSSDILADVKLLNLYTTNGLDEDCHPVNSSTSAVSASASETDASSEDGQSREQWQNKDSGAVRGRGGNRGRGNHNALYKTRTTDDLICGANDQDANGSDEPNKRQRKRPVRDKTEICMYFIKGHCKHEDKCFKAHDKMPYRWEVKEGDQWRALPDNEMIEKDYCDPKNTYYSVSCPPVHFDTMTCGTNQVRRLSTINCLIEPTFIHTTEWLWYWEDEFGKWNLYASATAGHSAADMDSAKLEKMFLDNDKDVVEFTAGSQSYTLSFQDMIQTNKHYSTKRLVRRRPRFVSAVDVREKRVRRPLGPLTFATIPDHWDKTQVPTTGYKPVSLERTSAEFKEIEALFCKTMRGFDIVKLERIQNKALWEVFQWQRNQMKNNKSVHSVMEKKLFHGTDSKYVDAICSTNFDWRICGTHGTAFGKGSYFARDAKYSHNYTSDSDVKSMFVSRVLVGDFTKGSSDYRRPPSKDGGDINFYDSCVDDVTNPSIFVVFEKHQIYPEYLLQYKNMHPLVDLYSGMAATTSRPAPQPKVSVQQTVTGSRLSSPPSYKSSPSSNQPSTSSFNPAKSSYQPTTSSYNSGTSSYQPSTLSYNSGTSSYQPKTSLHVPSTQSTSLSYQTSTGLYKYDTNQSSPSPSPNPKKNSDSCVIV